MEEKCQNGEIVVGADIGLNPDGIQVLPCNPVISTDTSVNTVDQNPQETPKLLVLSPQTPSSDITHLNGKKYDINEKISEYFTLKEMVICQDDWKARNWEAFTYYNYSMAIHLCNTLLDPIREHFGQPMIITSGFRCPDYNKLKGGVWNSQHIFGQAADFFIKGVRVWDIVSYVANRDLVFGQVIAEYKNTEWVHISLGEGYTDRTSNYEIWEYTEGKYYRLNKEMERV